MKRKMAGEVMKWLTDLPCNLSQVKTNRLPESSLLLLTIY